MAVPRRSATSLAFGLALALASLCSAQIKTTRYEEDPGIFPNPEQGFYKHATLERLDAGIGKIRGDGLSLALGVIDLTQYRDSSLLPESFLKRIRGGFQVARDQGVKVIVRGSYGHRGPGGDYRTYEDPPKELIQGHIQQLTPIFSANTDVIASFQAGFVGPWGEWHGTTIATNYDLGREMVLFLLAHTPSDRMVAVRYPYLKQRIFASPDGGYEVVGADNAYSGSPVARVGHHNDCFLASETDMGTYNRGGSRREQETAYLAADTLYTVFGGETCMLHEFNDCSRAVKELETVHGTYLNLDYHRKVLGKWKQQGCFDEIQRRLGARLVVTESRIAASAAPGGALEVEFHVNNVGFAPLYNRRVVQIVLKNEGDDRLFRFGIDMDPRQWKPGKSYTVRHRIALPNDIPQGSYALFLNLPDAYRTLQDDPRYSFRIACKGVWDAATGLNQLAGGIAVAAPTAKSTGER